MEKLKNGGEFRHMTAPGSEILCDCYCVIVVLLSCTSKYRRPVPLLQFLPLKYQQGALLQDVALFQFESTQSFAEIFGIVCSATALAYYVKRCIDTRGSPSDWPGPKAPVAGMALVAFFALNICLQGLRT